MWNIAPVNVHFTHIRAHTLSIQSVVGDGLTYCDAPYKHILYVRPMFYMKTCRDIMSRNRCDFIYFIAITIVIAMVMAFLRDFIPYFSNGFLSNHFEI